MLLTEFDEEKDWAIMARGYKEGKKDFIKTMLSNGKTKKEIVDFIGISEDEFDQIMNS